MTTTRTYPMARRAKALVCCVASIALTGPAGVCAQTLKERLSDKASDEQRIDNCRVPIERRGATPRPDCPPSTPPSSAAAAKSR